MQALWASSQKPMYVRTVWVNGHRHAVLTKDDPLLQKGRRNRWRPTTGVPYSQKNLEIFKSRPSQNTEQLEECIQHLRLLKKDTLEDSDEGFVEKLELGGLGSDTEESVLKVSSCSIRELESSKFRIPALALDMPVKKEAVKEEKEDNFDLSERVLQWLDLAGKIDLLSPDPESQRIAQQRHSCPEIEKKISQKFYALREQEKLKLEVKQRLERARININSQCHAIEQSRNENKNVEDESKQKNQSQLTSKNKIEESTLKKTKAVKSPMGLKIINLDTVSHTRERVAAEMKEVERQFAALLSRGLTTDACARHIKRQLHIFMPPLPKKVIPNTH